MSIHIHARHAPCPTVGCFPACASSARPPSASCPASAEQFSRPRQSLEASWWPGGALDARPGPSAAAYPRSAEISVTSEPLARKKCCKVRGNSEHTRRAPGASPAGAPLRERYWARWTSSCFCETTPVPRGVMNDPTSGKSRLQGCVRSRGIPCLAPSGGSVQPREPAAWHMQRLESNNYRLHTNSCRPICRAGHWREISARIVVLPLFSTDSASSPILMHPKPVRQASDLQPAIGTPGIILGHCNQ